jgi:hypothetical protein
MDDCGNIVAKTWRCPEFLSSVVRLSDELRHGESVVEEVCEGEMIMIYCFDKEWMIASEHSPVASNMVGINQTYKEAVEEYLLSISGDYWRNIFSGVNPMYCFVFIYADDKPAGMDSDYKMINRMPLYDVINMETGQELHKTRVSTLAHELGLYRPVHKTTKSLKDIYNESRNIDIPSPGILITGKESGDKAFIPNKIYQALKEAHDLGSNALPRHIAKVFVNCKRLSQLSKIMNAQRGYAEFFKLFTHVRLNLKKDLKTLWHKVETIEDPVTFSESVRNYPFSYILNSMKGNTIASVGDGVNKITADQLVAYTEKTSNKKFKESMKSWLRNQQ